MVCPVEWGAHPRLRGEHENAGDFSYSLSGSSPPTRGTPHLKSHTHPARRLIPAYAGNTKTELGRQMWASAHPRLRGEHTARWSSISVTLGSSPPTRGTPLSARYPEPAEWLIPAYAGNTLVAVRRCLLLSAHPRLRGEHCFGASVTSVNWGSSPPTRGTRRSRHRSEILRRLIPAYAGNTCSRIAPRRTRPAHPRLRGEHELKQYAFRY